MEHEIVGTRCAVVLIGAEADVIKVIRIPYDNIEIDVMIPISALIFSDSELSEYLLNNNPSAVSLKKNNPDEFHLIVRISEGKIGQAERLLADSKTDKFQSKHEKAGELLELSGDSSKYADLLTYVQKMASNRETMLDILLYATYAVRDLAAVKRADSERVPLLFYSDYDLACSVASNFTAAGVVAIYDLFCRARIELASNANLGMLQTNLACELRKAANI